VDPGVQAEAELAEPAGARVEVEHREQIRLPLVGAGRDDATAVEFEGDADQLAAASADGETATEPPPGGRFDRAGEDLARRHVAASVGVDPGAAGYGKGQVGPVRLDSHRLDPGHELDETRLTLAEFAPGGDRVGPIQEHGGRDVRLVGGQR